MFGSEDACEFRGTYKVGSEHRFEDGRHQAQHIRVHPDFSSASDHEHEIAIGRHVESVHRLCDWKVFGCACGGFELRVGLEK